MSRLDSYDVIVVGAGAAGIATGICAARNGAKVLLIEQDSLPGGAATKSLVAPLLTWHDRKGRLISGGIGQEIVGRLVRKGGALPPHGYVDNTIGGFGYTHVPIDERIYLSLLYEMLQEAKVDLLLYAKLFNVIAVNHFVRRLDIATNSGPISVSAKIYVDASGNALLTKLAGGWIQALDPDKTQPLTKVFKVGGVKRDYLIRWALDNKNQFYESTRWEILQDVPILALSGWYDLWQEAKSTGEITIERQGLLIFEGLYPGEFWVNATRISVKDPTNSEELTRAEMLAEKQIAEVFRFMKTCVYGCHLAYIKAKATHIGVRESYRIVGDYVLTEQDVVDGRCFDDEIALSSYPIDIHRATSDGKKDTIHKEVGGEGVYGIPYRSLIPRGLENVLVAGRCFSATHEALGSARVTANCFAMGQAAGTAAALCILNNEMPRDLIESNNTVSALQFVLLEQGAIL